jgi:hypothetical protein
MPYHLPEPITPRSSYFAVVCRLADVREVGQQALRREQAGGGVALVVLHDVRALVGVEDHSGVLLDLLESLALEPDRDARVLALEDLDRPVPGDAHRTVRALVVPQLERRGAAAALLVIAAAAGEDGGRRGDCHPRGEKPSVWPHRYSPR